MTTAPSAEPPEATPTVSSELLALLKLEGVSHTFGIPGGALILMLAALKADGDLTYLTCRQETGAAFMADGYSRVSGGLAIVLVTSGPGATNALKGAINADASHSPTLVITGDVAEKFFGLGYLQEGAAADLDVVAVYSSALAYSELITSATNFRQLFESVMRTAWGTPRRATHLSLPGDVAGSPATGFSLPSDPREVSGSQQLRGQRRRRERCGRSRQGEAPAGDARKRLPPAARGFLMQVGEVATAAQYNLGAIWIVLADHDLSMVSQGMAATQGDPSYDGYYKLGWANLAAVARGLDAEASSTQSVDEVAAALDRAIGGAEAGVPQVVVVAIDPTEAPPYNYQPPSPPPSTR